MVAPKSHTQDWAPGPFSSKPQRSQLQIFSSVLWTSLLFLLMGLRASGKDSAPTVVSGILGGSVTLPLNISVDTAIEHVIWIGPKKALAFARPKENVTFMAKSYRGRLNITRGSYSLSISNLTLNDAGSYKAQINQRNFEVTTEEEFTLFIYAPFIEKVSVHVIEGDHCTLLEGSGLESIISTLAEPYTCEHAGGLGLRPQLPLETAPPSPPHRRATGAGRVLPMEPCPAQGRRPPRLLDIGVRRIPPTRCLLWHLGPPEPDLEASGL
ncbi:PREDICTED: T-lymphocyte surface antigen Ly-9 isoform X4 [Colobus angolensis palliatus]|uniref:T-lymphocyte surface antigen Ly-9 isoform X4 n=1 Tax=Colobus angolensis palliatus TaxID=336983 RepID=UPI0005F4C825|nr:PREDICTED: T-lymphocyte surface antigen Ly-9 isoform X4 [Colobus angolensis palliatus]